MCEQVNKILELLYKMRTKSMNEDKFEDAMVLFYEGVCEILNEPIEDENDEYTEM